MPAGLEMDRPRAGAAGAMGGLRPDPRQDTSPLHHHHHPAAGAGRTWTHGPRRRADMAGGDGSVSALCREEWRGLVFVWDRAPPARFGRTCVTPGGLVCVVWPCVWRGLSTLVDVRACPRIDMLVRVATGFAGRGGHLYWLV